LAIGRYIRDDNFSTYALKQIHIYRLNPPPSPKIRSHNISQLNIYETIISNNKMHNEHLIALITYMM